MVNPKGTRRGTRYMFARSFKKHGVEPLSTFLRVYKRGQIVDIKGNGAFQKGMPFKHYHGKTGRVFNVTPHAVGVIVNKRVRNRVIPKRINIRVEHVRPSKCRLDFLNRVKSNELLRAEAKKDKRTVTLKREMVEPRKGHFVKTRNNAPQELSALKFEIIA